MTTPPGSAPPAASDPASALAPAPARPLRADARRNRAKVLEAAREVFAAEGLAVPLDEIARRAGVGAGTVYRHFPTKEALFEAVVVDRLEALAADGQARLAAPDPGPAFFEYFTRLVLDAGEKADLADLLASSGVALQESTLAAGARMKDVLHALLTRAQQSGAVRADVTADDLHSLAVGAIAAEQRNVTMGNPTPPGHLVRIICDGLAARS
ncbi:MAG TPA: helix-turn-helix domain-containing protein [Actinocrinis sp.]|nr:helix-turn-helix domain-containing protein [Actinocrinis sp.]